MPPAKTSRMKGGRAKLPLTRKSYERIFFYLGRQPPQARNGQDPPGAIGSVGAGMGAELEANLNFVAKSKNLVLGGG